MSHHGPALLALTLALAAAGCPKQTDTPDTAPAPGDETERVVAPADVDSAGTSARAAAPRTRGPGIWGAVGGLTPTAAQPTQVPLEPPPGPAAPPPPEFGFQRLQASVDVPRLVGSPVWTLVRALAEREFGSDGRCVLQLLERAESVYLDVAIDVRGDAEDVLLSVHTGSSTTDVLSCFRDAFNGGAAFVEVPVGGRTGWADPGDDGANGVLVDAGAGWWLLALPERAEQLLLSGARPEDDPGFADLTGPLGPFAIRIAAVPRAGVEQSPFGSPEDGEVEACLAASWPSLTGFAAGLSLTATVDGGLDVRTGSPEAAAEVRACVASAWERMIAEIAGDLDAEEAATARRLFGMPLEDALRSVRIETLANFTTVRASFPLGALLGVLQDLAM